MPSPTPRIAPIILAGTLAVLATVGNASAQSARQSDTQQETQPPQASQPTRAQIRDQIFVTAQRGQNSVAGRALSQAASRIAAGSQDLAALLRERQDQADNLQALIDRLAEHAQSTGAQTELKIATLKGAIRGAKARISTLDQQLEKDFPEFKELTNPAPLRVDQVQALLRQGEALLMTFTDENYTYVWAISKTRADWHRAPLPRADLAAKVQLLRAQLTTTGNNRAGKALKKKDFVARIAPFDRGVAHRIYRDVFQPLEPVFKDSHHVMVVVDGPLTSLPLSVLVTQPPSGDDDTPAAMRETGWLLKRHALTTLPSVSALRALRLAGSRRAPTERRKRKTDASPFLGFGDPLLGYRLAARAGATTPASPAGTQIVTRGVYDDVKQVAELAPLPNTARELRKLAQTMGAAPDALFLSEAATETAVKSTDLSGANVLAFATHGLLADGLPGLSEPALVFTPPKQPDATDDALLTASEAAELKLSADLVILSACDTAGSDGTPGAEGLSGLARAFIYAGARAILVSHWPVDDYAASALTTGMLENMYGMEPTGRAMALQKSALQILNDPSQDRLAHPRIWAPFVVVGEGGRD